MGAGLGCNVGHDTLQVTPMTFTALEWTGGNTLTGRGGGRFRCSKGAPFFAVVPQAHLAACTPST